MQTGQEIHEPALHRHLHIFRQRSKSAHGVFARIGKGFRGNRWVGRVHAFLIGRFRLFLPVVVFLLLVHACRFHRRHRVLDAVGQAVDIAANLKDARNLQVVALLHQPGQFRDIAGIGPVHVGQLGVVFLRQRRSFLHAGAGRFENRIIDRLADILGLVVGDGEQSGHGLLDFVRSALDRQSDINHGLRQQALRIHLHQHCKNPAQVLGAAGDALNRGIDDVRHRTDFVRRVHPVLYEPGGHLFLIRHQPVRSGNEAFRRLPERTQRFAGQVHAGHHRSQGVINVDQPVTQLLRFGGVGMAVGVAILHARIRERTAAALAHVARAPLRVIVATGHCQAGRVRRRAEIAHQCRHRRNRADNRNGRSRQHAQSGGYRAGHDHADAAGH